MEKIFAKGKINLTLNVLGRRENGYHDLELIFQPVSLADVLTIEENDLGKLRFTCSVEAFSNENNLVCRGYELLKREFSEKICGLDIFLEKNIPSGAGMGGGSTDCSALMVWMNEHFSLGLTRQELIDRGVTLGADVPACMFDHATIGRGVGEVLDDIETSLEYPILLLKPEVAFPTGAMYQRLDESGYAHQVMAAGPMVEAMKKGDLPKIGTGLYNVFEDVVPEKECIEELKRMLMENGALGSLMTGSGSVVFGVYSDVKTRDEAAQKIKDSGVCRVICCETVNRW